MSVSVAETLITGRHVINIAANVRLADHFIIPPKHGAVDREGNSGCELLTGLSNARQRQLLMADNRNDDSVSRRFSSWRIYGKSGKAIIATKDGECFLLRAGKMHEDIYIGGDESNVEGKRGGGEEKETERREFVLE